MEKNEEVVLDTDPQEGEGELGNDLVQIPKADWEKTNQTLGSLKRQLKDLQKTETKETPTKETKTEESSLLQKLERMSLRQAGLTHQDDVELARATAKKWNVDIDEVLSDEDFKVKLERQQASRSNAVATSNIKGSGGTSGAKTEPAYWIAKGVPPSASDVPNRKDRAKIVRAFIEKGETNGKTFYNY